jgi:CheY-like chemotaxis protein
MKNGKLVEILIIEDNTADTRLITEVFNSFKTKKNIYQVKDGIEAMNFLRKKDKYKDFPKPDIIILDLNLPNKNGFEVLKEIKEDEKLKNIPVVVLDRRAHV